MGPFPLQLAQRYVRHIAFTIAHYRSEAQRSAAQRSLSGNAL